MSFNHLVLLVLILLLGIGGFPAQAKKKKTPNPRVQLDVRIQTDESDVTGSIEIELFADKAPRTVENFLRYMDEGFYDGSVFHRVIKGFMIQGGGFDRRLSLKATHLPIENEAANALRNHRGTVAMARTNNIHSATSQFFINLEDNYFLDFRDKSPRGYGYAVFGKVLYGMKIVNLIASVPVEPKPDTRGVTHTHMPQRPVILERVFLVKPENKDASGVTIMTPNIMLDLGGQL